MSSNDSEKDFVDKFFDYFNKYKDSGVRFFAVALTFFLLFILGLLIAPLFIKMCTAKMPFKVEFLVLTPFDIFFNYCKIALFFASILTFPLFLYQFGKLKYENIDDDQKTDRIITSLVFAVIILLGIFLTYSFIFPTEILFLYGLNFNVTSSTTSFSAIITTFIYTDLLITMLLLLPYINYLIRHSKFFNYSELIKYKKTVMIYSGILTAIIALPIEFIALGAIFMTFFLWYKVLVSFSKTRS